MALPSSQINAYFDRIALPEATRRLLFEGPNGKDALQAVTTLQQHHLAAVPYENLELHYSSVRTLPLDVESVYHRVVEQKRGGLCPQMNILFTQILKSIGFQAYITGGRLNAAASIASIASNIDRTRASFGAWVHVLPLVLIGKQWYIVETNFNTNGPSWPIALVHDQPADDVAPRQRRVIHSSIPMNDAESTQKWWRLQLRPSQAEPWMDIYCFTEAEWLPLDLEIMTAGIRALGGGVFTKMVEVVRFIVENQEPVGYIQILGDELVSCRRGKTEVLQKFYSESDRLAALEDEFGITLAEDEQAAIKGTSTEIVETSFDYYQ